MADHDVLHGFTPAVREWFSASFPEPTPPQVQGWPAIRSGQHTLVCAPTGSGKTLTAFLSSLDRLVTPAEGPGGVGEPIDPKARTRVLYISPLRALAFDVEKNTGSIRAKSPSACIRSIRTEPTMPRQPTRPTRFPIFIAKALSDYSK